MLERAIFVAHFCKLYLISYRILIFMVNLFIFKSEAALRACRLFHEKKMYVTYEVQIIWLHDAILTIGYCEHWTYYASPSLGVLRATNIAHIRYCLQLQADSVTLTLDGEPWGQQFNEEYQHIQVSFLECQITINNFCCIVYDCLLKERRMGALVQGCLLLAQIGVKVSAYLADKRKGAYGLPQGMLFNAYFFMDQLVYQHIFQGFKQRSWGF
eukprot:TRINITY_DN558_c0_g1_i11.p2 TRINITY_DN558_c0_g1~~TRINITY_DN558_c0_g1_i11.p2  ORF type:complete len:213 (-),score=15.24 TRINITY_DN558_c0_g1_i11:533-1171(-)